MAASLSISVVTYGVARSFVRFLAGLEEALLRAVGAELIGEVQIFLVDNLGEPEKLRPLLAEAAPAVEYIRAECNLGYGGGHNLVINRSDCDYHLMLNPDVILHPDALAEGLRFLQSRPDVALAGPRGFAPDGKEAHLCKAFPKISDLLLRGLAPGFVQRCFGRKLARYERHDLSREEPSLQVELLSGCCMLARRALLSEVGGFDEKFFLYFEDFDLSMRMRQKWQLANIPSMQIIHHGGGTASKGLRHIWYFLCSGLLFFARYGVRGGL